MGSRALASILSLAVIALSGCASLAPPPPTIASSRPAPLRDVRHLAVVASGETKFSVAGPTIELGSAVDQILKWYPPAATWAPLVRALQWGLNWLGEETRTSAAAPHVQDVSPGLVVAEAFTRTLAASGTFDQIRTFQREPVGEARRQSDALVRLTVPAWGLLRVREGQPELMAAYADVRAQMVVRPTGALVWEHDEDVTHAERLPLRTFTGDRELARQELVDVLERAGQRLANEFLYAWSVR